jgi:hypothetical protein
MRFGFVGASYTARSTAIAAEECINLYAQTVESVGAIVPVKAYGGETALPLKAYLGTPGKTVFCALGAVPRATLWTGTTLYAVTGTNFVSVTAAGVFTVLGTVANDGNPASLAFNSIQVLIVSGGQAYCWVIATATLVNVTAMLHSVPLQCDYADSFFVVSFVNSNIFQISQVLDGTTWPGQLVNEVSVFAENIVSIIFNQRELWVFGSARTQPYQDTGSAEIYDVIPGALIETGSAATFSPARLDNSIFWIGADARGSRMAWRANGYTPTRISAYAVETDLATYTAAQIAGIVTYAYQDAGHEFWVVYIPGAQWTWVYDNVESLWHKRYEWNSVTAQSVPDFSWNHIYAFGGLHIVGDWNSGNLYQLNQNFLTSNGNNIRRVRRSPTIGDEMQYMFHSDLTVDFDSGQSPQPPLLDGSGNPRSAIVLLRWSDDRGKTWSNLHPMPLGFAGEFTTRVIWRRLGRSRYRVYEMSIIDPVPVAIVDAYLNTSAISAAK